MKEDELPSVLSPEEAWIGGIFSWGVCKGVFFLSVFGFCCTVMTIDDVL